MSSSICHVLLSLILCVLLQEHTLAIKQSYIVYLGSHSFGPNPSSVDIESATNYHYNLLGSYVGSTEKAKEAIFYSYNRYINGFAAVLDEDEAANVAKHPNVISVFLNKKYELQTTRSWNFLGLERQGRIPKASSAWSKTLGEDIIIANFDTGVWPESKSFSDEEMGPIPKKWRGICQVANKNPDKFHCNRKLIGARYFHKSIPKSAIVANETFHSARDIDGHGSHTLSTAGGNFVFGANILGYGNGTASGGSPKSRVATYKVCWKSGDGCWPAEILAAFEAAIGDGVDVISVSLGSPPVEYFQNAISIGSFHANAHGIIVVTAGGNSGPAPSTVSNLDPWVFTTAASTIDRDFASDVTLGNNKILKGTSLSRRELAPHKFYPLISAADAKVDNATTENALFCKDGSLDPQKAKGKILVCFFDGIDGTGKGVYVARAGAVGMILANNKDLGDTILPIPHVLPASCVSFIDGSYILNYIKHTKYPMAYISKVITEIGIKPTPIVASFSGRGPNIIEPTILKPDITAPGVNIIAAFSEALSIPNIKNDKRISTPFMIESGTSMSCPHVAGVVGLVKALHPNWSPAAIKSAIMTTATTHDNTRGPILNSSLMEKATPFEYGAGHIQPNRAVDPGLVYDLNITDYLDFLCGHGYNSSQMKLFYNKPYTCPKSFNLVDFNYPAITVPNIKIGHSINVTRTLTNVGPPQTYKVHINTPPGLSVSVYPNKLSFKEKGEKRKFIITLTLGTLTKSKVDYIFGSLDWSYGRYHVRSPIVVHYSH